MSLIKLRRREWHPWKSPKTVDWIADAIRYFPQFLGDQAIHIMPNNGMISGVVFKRLGIFIRFTQPLRFALYKMDNC